MMRSQSAVSCVVLLAVFVQSASANPNGLGRLPPMGWNTWYECGLVFVASLAGGLTTPSVLVAVLHFHRCTLSSCHQPGNYSHAYHDVCNEWMVKSVAQANNHVCLVLCATMVVQYNDAQGTFVGSPSVHKMKPTVYTRGSIIQLTQQSRTPQRPLGRGPGCGHVHRHHEVGRDTSCGQHASSRAGLVHRRSKRRVLIRHVILDRHEVNDGHL